MLAGGPRTALVPSMRGPVLAPVPDLVPRQKPTLHPVLEKIEFLANIYKLGVGKFM